MVDKAFDVSIFVITETSEIIEGSEYDFLNDGSLQFIMLTNERLNPDYGDNNTIFIHRDLKMIKSHLFRCYFQLEDKLIPNIVSIPRSFKWTIQDNLECSKSMIRLHLNGECQTRDILMNVRNLIEDFEDPDCDGWKPSVDGYIPIINEIHNLTLKFDNKMYHGYLPSIGQLVYISENLSRINTIRKKGRLPEFPYRETENDFSRKGLNGIWWSSTEREQETMYAISYGKVSATYKQMINEGDRYALPLFALQI